MARRARRALSEGIGVAIGVGVVLSGREGGGRKNCGVGAEVLADLICELLTWRTAATRLHRHRYIPANICSKAAIGFRSTQYDNLGLVIYPCLDSIEHVGLAASSVPLFRRLLQMEFTDTYDCVSLCTGTMIDN